MINRFVVATLTVVLLAGCAGKASTPQPQCQKPDEALLLTAVPHYVESLDPMPQRFLYNEGSDTSIGSLIIPSIAQYGPAYILPQKESDLQSMEKLLKARAGSLTTLFLIKGPIKLVDDSTASVTVRGKYFWFKNANQPAPEKAILYACRDYNWVLKDSGATKKQ